ncbi:MAG: glycosyltransferase [Desulfosoma sp.]
MTPSKDVTISLCMIVRNEEANLPRCLDSVRDQVDEIIVVDTGSQDRTRDIAALYGAKVLEFQWNNDFSAARNVSVQHATGDWVLWLDADEELLPSPEGVTLRQLAACADAAAYLIPIENVKLQGSPSYHWAVRFFKKCQGVRFEGRVHEGVSNSLLRMGMPLDRAPVAIRHWGYAVSEERLQEKIERNLGLLKAYVREHPEDSFAHYYMGVTLLVRGEHDGSLEYLEKAHALDPPTDNLRSLVFNLLSYHHLYRKNYKKAEEYARSSLKVTPNQHTGKLFLGLSLYHQQKYSEALPFLLAAYQFQRLPLEMRRSDLSSEEYYSEPELLWLVGRSAYETGNHTLAYQFLQRFLRMKSRDAVGLALLGLCTLQLGDPVAAARHLGEAKAEGASWSSVGPPWVYALVRLGSLQEAAFVLREAGVEFFRNPDARSIFPLLVERCFKEGWLPQLMTVLNFIAEQSEDCPALVLDALAVCCIKTERFEEAARVLSRMAEKDPANREIRRRLAAVYARLGRKPEAVSLLRTVEGHPG